MKPAPVTRCNLVPSDLVAGGYQLVRDLLKTLPSETRMCLACRRERWIYTGVKLDLVELEPSSTARLKQRRFLDLGETKNTYVEIASCFLAVWRYGDLDVIDSLQLSPRSTVTTLPINSTPVVKTIGS